MANTQGFVRIGGDWAAVRPDVTRLDAVNLETYALMRTRRRVVLAALLFIAVFGVISGRLLQLTFGAGSPIPVAFSDHGEQRIRPDILDRDGRVLATHILTTTLTASADKIVSKDTLVAHLVDIMPDLNAKKLAALLSRNGKVIIARQLKPSQANAVLELGNPHLELSQEATRVYPGGNLAPHVTGFVSVDQKGLAGLEYYLDQNKDWSRPLVTTLDLRVQNIMRQTLVRAQEDFSAKHGAAIMLNVRSGEILGLVSVPDFNPNLPMQFGKAPHFNHATLAEYELGSVFKIFTLAMAFESGRVGQDDTFDTTDPLKVGKYTINDVHGLQRPLTPREILVHSSNIGSGKIALMFDADEQARFWTDLGFYDRLSLEIPERGTSRPPERLGEVERVTASYGHGIAMPPLKMLSAGAAMVNGGVLYEPHLLPVGNALGARVISEDTSNILRDMLRDTVATGTGRNGEAEGFFVIGKTGSANKPSKGGYADDQLLTSFFAAFPYDDPQYALLVVLDEPQATEETRGYNLAGWNVAPAASEIIEKTAPILGISARHALRDTLNQPLQEDKPIIDIRDTRLLDAHEGGQNVSH